MVPRGGIPRIKNVSIDTTGRFIAFDALSSWVRIKTSGALRVYATEDDFTDNVNFYEIASNEFFEAPIEDRGIWLRGNGGTHTAQILILHRKG